MEGKFWKVYLEPILQLLKSSFINYPQGIPLKVHVDMEFGILKNALYIAYSMFHIAIIHQTFLCYKDNYQADFYRCPCSNLLKIVVLVP